MKSRHIDERNDGYRHLFSSMRGALLIADNERTIIDVNPAFTKVFGFALPEIVGKKTSFIMAHHQQFIDLGKSLATYSGSGPLVYEADYKKKNGEIFSGEVEVSLYTDGRGEQLGYIDLIRDITERKLIENKLIHVMKAVESASDAIGMSDAEAHHFYQNKAYTDLFGYATAEELETVGGGAATVKDPSIAFEIFDTIMHGRSWAGELELVKKDGSVFPAFERADAIKDNDGNIIGLIGIISDITERKQAEETLLYFQMAVGSSTDAIGMSTPKGRHYYQNEAYTKLFGLSVGEVDGVSGPPSTVYADEKEGMRIFDIIMKGGAFEGEVKMLDKDKNEKDIYLRAYSIKNKKGEVVGLVGVHNDITGRKKAEEKLKKSERRLRESQEVARLGSWDLDLVSQKLEWSEETYNLFDKTPDEFTPSFDEFAQLVHLDDRETMRTNFNKALEINGSPYHVAVRIINDSGREWVMEAFGAVRRDESGKPLGIFGTAQDITDQKKSEEVLRQKEEMMRNLLDSVDEGFIVVDRDYRILSANRAFCDQVGLNPANIVGKHCFAVSHKTDQPCFENGSECAPRLVFETGEPHVAVHRHMDQKNEMIFVETKAFPLKDRSGQVTSVIEVINNITEKQLLEEERLKIQKLEAVGTLAGGIAHDFNNLLQGVFGYISMAKLNLDPGQKSLAMLEQAEKALHMSVNLTTQLLTFSKGGKPVRRKMKLPAVIENAVKFTLSGSRVDYELEVDGALWPVDADEGQISQVIQNIVLNAEQAMPMGGTVKILAKNFPAGQKGLPAVLPHGNYVLISLTDSGIGIPAEYLPKIFDPYFTTKDKGSGLGLATSYSIIKNHGGMIEVRSEMGKGSTFLVWLPAVEAVKEMADSVAVTGSAIRKARILLMDDEEIVRNIAGEMIRSLGHEVEFAINGEEAITKYKEALLQGKRFDAVILDLTIRGGMGGEAVIKTLFLLDPDVKAVVSSGYADSAAISQYEAFGFRTCLTKPYSIEKLNSTINSILE
jgi:two-component system cell cycle sensor histidine kinase/response regulator CckA